MPENIIERILCSISTISLYFISSSAGPSTTVIATTVTGETARRERVIPINLSSGSPPKDENKVVTNIKSVNEGPKTTFSKQERVIPIHREGDSLQGRNTVCGTLGKQQNGNHVHATPTPHSTPGKRGNIKGVTWK